MKYLGRSNIPPRRIQQPNAPFDVSLLVNTLNDTLFLKAETERKLEKLLKDTEQRASSHTDTLQKLDTQLNKEIHRISSELVARIESHVGELDMVLANAIEEARRQIKNIPYFKGDKGADGDNADEERIERSILDRVTSQITEHATKMEEKTTKLFQKIETVALKNIADKLMASMTAELDKMKAEIRHLSSKIALGGGPSGGGMGTIKYFKFTCDGATTEFTLPDTPTQEGAATFAYYQSARLHNTEHFTVSGRTLTMTFIGDNGQIIDGWLVT